jgi:DNA invertase Pin-like site-specific DNA recombinase
VADARTPPRAVTRCAIYTRKSSEEGLEQDFNSLDAQREACAAFIKSQKHEGWTLVSTSYDDGGFSGGTVERPALKRLLCDIGRGKVDVIVVYKVDRLTRSLADFAKIVELLDSKEASFVSVTQQFNTTTSMGRLTLNVLLSFAQFEREVTGERIRDKIAASKKKGMWMGGLPPLGYDARDRKLVVNAREAEVVRHIFRRYAAVGSVRLLKQELDAEGVVSKLRASPTGRRWGGQPLARGALYRMLQNRIYLGEIVHKDRSYPGEHPAIIDQSLWKDVQWRLRDNRTEKADGTRAVHPSLLAGLLHGERGEGMSPSHAVKRGTRYRYYVSRSLITRSRSTSPQGCRIPAGEIEPMVGNRLCAFLSDRAALFDWIRPRLHEASRQGQLMDAAADLARRWPDLAPSEQRATLRALVARIDIRADRVDIQLALDRLPEVLQQPPLDPSPNASDGPRHLVLSVRARFARAGLGTKLIVEGQRSSEPDATLIKLLLKAETLRTVLLTGGVASIEEIAKRQGVTSSYVTRLLRLAFLAPDIAAAILHGRHSPELTAATLLRHSRLALDWSQQRVVLGFA